VGVPSSAATSASVRPQASRNANCRTRLAAFFASALQSTLAGAARATGRFRLSTWGCAAGAASRGSRRRRCGPPCGRPAAPPDFQQDTTRKVQLSVPGASGGIRASSPRAQRASLSPRSRLRPLVFPTGCGESLDRGMQEASPEARLRVQERVRAEVATRPSSYQGRRSGGCGGCDAWMGLLEVED
jgi:hypothetical protein